MKLRITSCIIIIILSELRLNTELENGYRVHAVLYDLIKREEREFNTAMKETEKSPIPRFKVLE